MAFDPLLPRPLDQHVSGEGRIRVIASTEKNAQAESSFRRDEIHENSRDAEGSTVQFADVQQLNTAMPPRSKRYAPLRPIVNFGTALIALDAAFIGIAQVGWTEILRDWVVIKTAQAMVLAALSTFLSILVLYALDAYRREILMNLGVLTTRAIAAFVLNNALLFLIVHYGLSAIDAAGTTDPDAAQSEMLALLSSVLVAGAFVISRTVSYSLLARRCFTHRVLVVGSGKRARYLKELLGHGSRSLVNELIFVPETVIDNDRAKSSLEPVADLTDGPIDELARTLQIDEIVVAIDEGQQFSFEPFVACKAGGIPVVSYNCFIERETKRVDLNRPDLSWLVYSDGFRQSLADAALKRALDIFVSSVLLFISTPILVLAIVAVAIGRDGPVFFKQQRVTKDGRLFWLYKIRTMRQDAERNGPQWSSAQDPRITYVGAILRRFRIDEIPQLVNVLKGDMSLVGPRPEQPFFVEQLSREVRLYSLRHSVKAGITGWAQINYPYGASKADAVRKLEYELYYIKNYSFLQELSILLQTVRVLFWPPRAT